MDANEPGLFDLPDRERPGTANRPLRGRNRETWARTATAEVTVIDAGALHEAVAQAAGNAVTITLRADPDVEDTEPGPPDVAPASNAFDALGWLICPSGGMEGPLEAGAFRVLSLDSEVVAESVDRGTVTCRRGRSGTAEAVVERRIVRRVKSQRGLHPAGMVVGCALRPRQRRY